MPIYEYDCRKCGHRFEELVLRAGEAVKCPSCGTERVEKRLSVFASRGGGGGSASPAPA